MLVVTTNWKDAKEWQPILGGTKWNILRASRYMLGSLSPQREFPSKMKTLQVDLSVVKITPPPAWTECAQTCIWMAKTMTWVSPWLAKQVGVEYQTIFSFYLHFDSFYKWKDHNWDEESVLPLLIQARADNEWHFFVYVFWGNRLTSRAMLLKASSSAENRSFRGALFLPVPCVPMPCATAALLVC